MTVRRWIKAGRIQVIPVGREVRIPRTEVERQVGKVDGRLLVLSGRVSGHGQQDDLEIVLAGFVPLSSNRRSPRLFSCDCVDSCTLLRIVYSFSNGTVTFRKGAERELTFFVGNVS